MRLIFYIVALLLVRSCVDAVDYHDFSVLISDLERDGKYNEALEMVQDAFDIYPDYNFDLLKEQVYLNEKLGDYKANLDIFREGHKKGYFFLIHPSIPKYKPYLELGAFSDVSDADLRIRSEATRNAKPLIEITEPSGFRKSKRYPVIFIFHGGGSNSKRASLEWSSERLDKSYIKVFLQSPNHSDYNTFGWRNSDTVAVRMLGEAYDQLKNRFKADTSQIIVAGISAGGSSAVFSAFRSDVPVKKIITICPGIPENLGGKDYTKKPGVEVIIIGGENDYYRPRQERLIDSLVLYSIKHSYTLVPGMGHEYPENFRTLLNNLL